MRHPDLHRPPYHASRSGVITSLAMLILALVLCAGTEGCSNGSAAYQTYVNFTYAALQGDCQTLYALAEGNAIAHADYLCTPQTIMVMGKAVNVGSIAGNVAGIAPASTPFHRPIVREFTIESEVASDDGESVKLVVLEKSLQRHGNLLEPTWLIRHTVTVSHSGGKWKVTSFNEEVLRKYGD